MFPNSRFSAALLIAIGWIGLGGVSTSLAATAKEVDAAIEKAKAYLYTQQANGNWESASEDPREVGGGTALVTYALLAAGESDQDPRLQQALTYLKQCQMTGTYAIGIRCQVWQFLPHPLKHDVLEVIQHDAEALTQGGHADDGLHEVPSMFYTYSVTDKGAWDHSNSQYGVLGMWACAEAGYEVPTKYWQAVDSGWRAHQFNTGAWSYQVPGPKEPDVPREPARDAIPDYRGPRFSMTAAGVASLFITDDYLHGMDGIDCGGNIVDLNIEAGIKWMGDNFDSIYRRQIFYNFYGLERIGVASGRKYFGAVDWFKEGADYMLKNQGPNGSWGYGPGNTAFALLFMVRGRAPVVMNKLQYDIIMHANGARTANWNQRPRDAANFAKWAGPQVEQFLNWQVVNLSVPVSDLHDAPILYIAGNQALDFTDAEMAKLRQFVEEGGLIFANADCGSLLFSAAMHKIAHKLFPAYEFRTLPASSSIYTDEQFTRAKWSSHPALEALSNGARELIILAPANDPSRFWQTQTYRGRESMYQFMQDIFLYTVDRGEKGALRFKGDTYVVSADPNIHPGKHLKVARLQYPGNWDPEPGAWRRLAAILHNTDDTEVDVQPVNLGDSKLDNSYKVAHLTGTFKFSLAPASRAEIKKYVEGGGTLILDSCGGDASCAESLEKELAAIFPDAKLATAPLPPDSPAYAVGPKLAPVEYRPIERKIVGKLHTPRVRGLEINGRLGVFLSSEDLTCGMVGMPFDGIYGYEPDSATSLMEKLVLFAGK